MTNRAKPSAEAMIAATEMVNMGFADEGREGWLAHIIDDSHWELRESLRIALERIKELEHASHLAQKLLGGK